MKIKTVLLVLSLLALLSVLAGGYLCYSLLGSTSSLSVSLLTVVSVILLYRTGKKAIVREIDESKKAEEGREEALRASEKQYRNLVDNALVGIYKTDLEGKILYVNEALIKMMEFESYRDMKSVSVLARYSNLKDRDTFVKTIKETGKINDFEVDLLTKSGAVRNVILTGVLQAGSRRTHSFGDSGGASG
jgi:PAS domain S-box-containing protein